MSENIGKMLSADLGNMQWDLQSRSLYRRVPPPPFDYDVQRLGSLLAQRPLEGFPLICAFRNRVRETILRFEAAGRRR